jgi:hypothetical protein
MQAPRALPVVTVVSLHQYHPYVGYCLLLLVLGGCSMAFAEPNGLIVAPQSSQYFYQQLRVSRDRDDYRDREGVFKQLVNRYPDLDNLLINPEHEEDLTFNYLWMQQHQQNYKHRDGTDGASKLLKMGAKAMYKSYYGKGKIGFDSNDDITRSFSNVDYRMGVSTDRVKLGVEYNF